jgi:S-adenosylmethionine decarboxylase
VRSRIATEGEPFGQHATLDGYGGNPAALDDEKVIRQALFDLCDILGMHALAEPMVVAAPDNELRDPGGWSGFLLIAESHVSLHTFPRRRFLSADAYSCRNHIDVAAVRSLLTDRFGIEEFESHVISRGLRYPTHNIA